LAVAEPHISQSTTQTAANFLELIIKTVRDRTVRKLMQAPDLLLPEFIVIMIAKITNFKSSFSLVGQA
jgi:hypothetical protein